MTLEVGFAAHDRASAIEKSREFAAIWTASQVPRRPQYAGVEAGAAFDPAGAAGTWP
jgi:hypothetical protein